ncbi:MAG: hypothetical protein ACERKO_10310, partial [Acetanaerobacterium sp.]
QKKLLGIRLYPTIGAPLGAQRDTLLEYATQNHKRIFDYQVRYISENEVKSTNITLPTGHTLYEDADGCFIFSGGDVVHVRADLDASLENPNNPLYDTRGLLHDSLALGGGSLYDENGVLISFDDIGAFSSAEAQGLSYNNLIVNSYFACEVLDSEGLDVPLSVLGLSTLEDAQTLYDDAEDKVMIRGEGYVPVVRTDVLTLYYDGSGFLIDVHSLALPRKADEDAKPGILDYYELAKAADVLYTQSLNEIGLAPSFDACDLVPGTAVTMYNPYSGKIEGITPIGVNAQGELTLSLEALRVMYGVQLMFDPGTETLHMLTDPLYLDLVEHILGNGETLCAAHYVGADAVDETYLVQQKERFSDDSYLFEELSTVEEGVPRPIIRTPRTGQFVYPGSSTKIWVSYYKGKGEPVGLRPTVEGDWVWNDSTGFWEGVSPLSGQMVVWHPSYSAAFTIR